MDDAATPAVTPSRASGPIAAVIRRLNPRLRRLDQARRDATRRSATHPDHHWVFDQFPGYSGPMAEGEQVFFIGDRTSVEMSKGQSPPARTATVPTPPIDEEYFEWIDILEAALLASDSFTFLELGAGWGRWSARAALAARRLGKTVRLGLAEGDPRHVDLIHRHLALNGIQPAEYHVYEAAVSGSVGETVFTVNDPNEQPDVWYGQSMVGGAIEYYQPVGDHFGRPKYQLQGGGCEVILAPQIPLSRVLADFDFVDLADLDLQMAEREAVAEAIGPLTAKVRRLHIGTHAPDVERSLRDTLGAAGWVCLRDYPCQGVTETAFGPSHFNDGVQSWINPRLL